MKGKNTHLLFCTSGILLRRLLTDRNLEGITHVFVDEIHERGMNEGIPCSLFFQSCFSCESAWILIINIYFSLFSSSDFLLIVLKALLPRRRDLRLILMSATLNADLFSSYFGGAAIIHIPVNSEYLPWLIHKKKKKKKNIHLDNFWNVSSTPRFSIP